MRNRSLLLLTMLLLAIGILPAAPVGSIKGYIRDASGAPVPNATVRVKNELTNVTQDGKSDNAGLYQFLDLAPGVYSITAETAGFRQALVKSVTVLVDQIVSVDIKLEVGQITEVVIVDGGVTAVIDPEKSSTGTNFDPKLTANLPLTNRRFNDLALLTPGASFAAAGTQAGGFAAAGSRAQSTNWMIDGINDLGPSSQRRKHQFPDRRSGPGTQRRHDRAFCRVRPPVGRAGQRCDQERDQPVSWQPFRVQS